MATAWGEGCVVRSVHQRLAKASRSQAATHVGEGFAQPLSGLEAALVVGICDHDRGGLPHARRAQQLRRGAVTVDNAHLGGRGR
eukprot:6797741-Prymnesium_polylepis.1